MSDCSTLGLTEQSTPEEVLAAVEAALEAGMNKVEPEKVAEAGEMAENERKAKEEAVAACNAAKDALAAAEQERDAAKATAANAILDAGVTAGLPSKAEADAMRDAPDVEVAANAIGQATQARLPVQACLRATHRQARQTGALPAGTIEIGGRRVAINSERVRRASILEAVNARMEAHKESYDVAYNAIRRDAGYAPLFQAMKKPGEDAEG